MMNSAKSFAPLFRVDASLGQSLQEQIRRRVIEAIAADIFPPGRKLPSSRKLANVLGVSRNTVFLAYQQLIAEGHLEARERSGIFIAETTAPGRGMVRVAGRETGHDKVEAVRFLRGVRPHSQSYKCPPNWQKYRFPFIEGRYDKTLFPTAEWREASRLALAVNEVEEWSLDNGEVDDPALIEEIRTKLLPRRGIRAGSDELLVTVGEQQAFFLVAQLFADAKARICLEEPGLPDLRELFSMYGARLQHQPVDDEGLVVDARLRGSDLVYVSPSRQRPTGVTMSMERRRALLEAAAAEDFLIIEDDFECEMNYLGDALPALRSLDEEGRVIYIASLSKVLAPGVRLGFMVAPAKIINEARRLRDLTTRRPSPNNQRAAAFFLSLGHYDAMLRRLRRVSEERLIALRDALNHYRPSSIAIAPVEGGTTYWVRGPDNLDARVLIRAAEARGILIEPADDWFVLPDGPKNMFRLGVTGLPAAEIRAGIETLSQVMRELDHADPAMTPAAEEGWLAAEDIRAMMSPATLLYKTVYGEPCTIILAADGSMSGRSGYGGEDQDSGRWWIEGDKWYRQWRNWAFGEALGFHIRIDGDRLSWLDDQGRAVDGAVLSREPRDTPIQTGPKTKT
ncbi:PLP-dependent aminotransferase family protein [Maricaulis maris]|uniref:MocR-like pyridoxine biosynthesis transcription factor PdxR n=1 Tax=Maricaulis maris TaxID=74318 RepID=UPI0030C78023